MALLSSLTEELESRDFEVLPTHFGDGGLSLFKNNGPFAFVLADYRFIPGVKIKDCMQLVTGLHRINPFQQMAIVTPRRRTHGRKCRRLCGMSLYCGSRSGSSNCCDCCDSPFCRFCRHSGTFAFGHSDG